MNFRTVFIVLMYVLYVCASPYMNHIVTKRARYCGSTLQTVLSLVCHGRYASPQKRSHILNYNDLENDYAFGEKVTGYPFIPKEIAASLVPQKTRRSGVTDECCYQACTIKELQEYCEAEEKSE